MEVIIVKCKDFSFAINLRDVFKIVLKKDVELHNVNVKFEDYSFYNLTDKFRNVIKRHYPDEYYVLFANDETQVALSIENVEYMIEVDTSELYPLSDDIFAEGVCFFKYLYYDIKKKQGALLFDFQRLVGC